MTQIDPVSSPHGASVKISSGNGFRSGWFRFGAVCGHGWMTETGRGRRLIARTAIALLALAAATSAHASCTANVSGNHIFALTGDSCPFASGTYAPTVLAPGASPPAIVGLFANGGSITAGEDANAVTVNGPAATTYGLNAISGGTIGPLDVAGVTTAASSSPAVWAFGAGSTITLTLLSPTSPAVATIVTSGLDSAGVLSTSGGNVVLTGSGPTGGSVTTENNGSAGLNAFSGSISATGITITTMGDPDLLSNASDAVEVTNSGATVTLTDDTIKTYGKDAVGVLAQASGMATLSGTTNLTTADDGSIGLFASGGGVIDVNGSTTISTSGTISTSTKLGAYGLYANNGGTIDGSGATSVGVTTNGAGAIGVYASGTGTVGDSVVPSTITLGGTGEGDVATNTTVTTYADNAIGLKADGGGEINAFGSVTISTGSTGETPSGANAYGAQADGLGSRINLNAETTVTTVGTDAHGLYATNGGTIDGSLAPSVSVTTNGTGAIGVYASGTAPSPSTTPSTITIGGVATIMTNGATAAGVQADGGGVVNLNGGSLATPNTVTTITDGSIGVYAASAGVISINGATTISTGSTGETPSGANAYGVNADGAGSKVHLNAATTVTTLGTDAFGTTAYGLYASNGGTIDTSGTPSVMVTTNGAGAIGVYASGTGTAGDSVVPSTITIGGVATIVTNGGVATIDNDDTTVTVAAAGVQADNGGQVTLSGGGTVTTNGADAPGVVATGAGSMVTLSGTNLLTVTTITDDSIGLLATSGGVIDATGPVTISTGSTGETPSGANAYGANADGSGSKITFSGATTVTTNGAGANGLDAYGLYASNGGTIDGSLAPSVARHHLRQPARIGVYASGTSSTTPTTASTITIGGAPRSSTNGTVRRPACRPTWRAGDAERAAR